MLPGFKDNGESKESKLNPKVIKIVIAISVLIIILVTAWLGFTYLKNKKGAEEEVIESYEFENDTIIQEDVSPNTIDEGVSDIYIPPEQGEVYTDIYTNSSDFITESERDFTYIEKHDVVKGESIEFIVILTYKDIKRKKVISYDVWKMMPDSGIIVSNIEKTYIGSKGYITDIDPISNYREILDK